jgi:hypothetical protein
MAVGLKVREMAPLTRPLTPNLEVGDLSMGKRILDTWKRDARQLRRPGGRSFLRHLEPGEFSPLVPAPIITHVVVMPGGRYPLRASEVEELTRLAELMEARTLQPALSGASRGR